MRGIFTYMIKRNFTAVHHLFAFALALWFGLMCLRGFEFFSVIEKDTIGLTFKSFLAGFWNDLGLVIAGTLALGLFSFIISFLSKKVSVVAGGIFGFTLLFCSALLTFYVLEKNAVLNLGDFSFGEAVSIMFSTGFGGEALMPKLVMLLCSLSIFLLIYIFARGITNGKMILICCVLFLLQGILPPVKSLIGSNSNGKYIASNKVLSFFESSQELHILEIPEALKQRVDKGMNQAGLVPGFMKESSKASSGVNHSFLTLNEDENSFISTENIGALSEESLFKRVQKYAHSGKYFQAEASVKQLINTSPGNADYYYQYGLILAWQNKFDEALSQCYTALKISPNYQDVFLTIADIHYWSGDKPNAIHILDSGIVNLDNPDRLYVKKEQLQMAN